MAKMIPATLPAQTESKAERRSFSILRNSLVAKHGIERNRIAILGGHSTGRTCIGNNRKVGDFYISEEMEEGPNVINYHTYMKFKGCEADVVILLDVDLRDTLWAD